MRGIDLPSPYISTRQWSVLTWGHFLLLALLVIALVSCGVTSTTSSTTSGACSQQTTVHCLPTIAIGLGPRIRAFSPMKGTVFLSQSSQAVSPVSPPTWLRFNAPASTDMNGLHVQTVTGILCYGIIELRGLRPVYDQTTLAQMASYVVQFFNGPDYPSFSGNEVLPSPPSSLQVVPWAPRDASCSGDIQFTNTSNQTIQVTSVGMTYLAPSFTNTYHYSLIDGASLALIHIHGSGLECPTSASLTLTPGPADKSVQAPVQIPAQDSGCPLPPKGFFDVHIFVSSSAPDQVYQTQLFIEVAEGNGTITKLVLPESFDTIFPFTNDSLDSGILTDNNTLPCFGYNGTTFLQEDLVQENKNGYGYDCV